MSKILIFFIFSTFFNYSLLGKEKNPINKEAKISSKEINQALDIILEKLIEKKQKQKDKSITKKFIIGLAVTAFIIIESILIKMLISKEIHILPEKYKYCFKDENLEKIIINLSNLENSNNAYNDIEIKPIIDNLLKSIIFIFDKKTKNENLKEAVLALKRMD